MVLLLPHGNMQGKLIVILLCITSFHLTEEGATFSLKLVSYVNTRGRLSNGRRCDQGSKCDFFFNITWHPSIPYRSAGFPREAYVTHSYTNQNEVEFNSILNIGLSNPINIRIDDYQGLFYLAVIIYDMDNHENQVVDTLHANLSDSTPGAVYRETLEERNSKFVIEYNVTCLPGSHGVNCYSACEDTHSTSGYYTCTNGTKICLPGYTGAQCQNLTIWPCDNLPCQNGGNCTNINDGYRCKCTPGFSGPNCATNTTKSLTQVVDDQAGGMDWMPIVAGCLISFLVLLLLFIVLLVLYKRHQPTKLRFKKIFKRGKDNLPVHFSEDLGVTLNNDENNSEVDTYDEIGPTTEEIESYYIIGPATSDQKKVLYSISEDNENDLHENKDCEPNNGEDNEAYYEMGPHTDPNILPNAENVENEVCEANDGEDNEAYYEMGPHTDPNILPNTENIENEVCEANDGKTMEVYDTIVEATDQQNDGENTTMAAYDTIEDNELLPYNEPGQLNIPNSEINSAFEKC